MAAKFISRQAVIAILGAVAIASLALTIVMFPIALIWVGQPPGNVAMTTADAFATVFSVAFLLRSRSRWPSSRRVVANYIEARAALARHVLKFTPDVALSGAVCFHRFNEFAIKPCARALLAHRGVAVVIVFPRLVKE